MKRRVTSSWIKHCVATLSGLALVAGCAGGGGTRRPVVGPPATPASASAPAASVQTLYESGRYLEVLAAARTTDPVGLWFTAESHVRLGQREEARSQYAQLASVGATPAWQAVSDLALALLADDLEALDRARAAAIGFDADPYVQFALGLAHTRRNDFAAAAQAFDRCADANPRFAYAYYGAGLAYERLNRADLMVIRLEMFQRLADGAPERPEVDAILRTVRAR